MAKNIDILIFYSQPDNESLWVDNFKKFIELMVTQVQGVKPNVLQKSDTEDIDKNDLENSTILIPILTSSFLASGVCLDTLESYVNLSSKSKNKSIFKVLKYPVPINDQPSKIKNLLGYEFYQINYETGEIEDYKDFFSTDAEKNYWMRMVDLVYDIDEYLISAKGGTNVIEIKPSIERKAIYLAETGHDLVIQKNIIRRELQRHGYNVYPNHTLSTNLDDLKNNISKEIEESSLSIHLIGNSYGEIPEGSERSVVDLQNKIAAEKSSKIAKSDAKKDFSRLIWISPNLENISEKQKAFIENIKRDTSSLEGAEILQNPLEDFKNIIREELIEKNLIGFKNNNTGSDKKHVYIMHNKADEKEVVKIKSQIEKSGFQVLLPEFEGELLELRQKHIDNLRSFDVALIYKGNVNDQWVQMKILDILKAPGFGRDKPILGKAIIGMPGEIINQENYNNDVEIISGEEKKISESLQYFLESAK
ncbi:MAG: hypothetical protein OEW67_03095 [Cyclobacteriaceae bacterium]|nr:hypothetical protein [Cyclobacteriaceae bacterium]